MNYSTNYSMREPVPGEKVKVADINYNTEIIDGVMLDNRQISLEMYRDDETYNENRVVGHENAQGRIRAYRCLEDGTTGAWDDTKWVQTNISDELEDIRESVGASDLGDLGDVEITNPTDGQALLYDDTTDKWHNSDLPDADVTKEASGNPIEFTDGADAPLVKCVTEIQGYQEGTGTPSPENVRHIVAYTENTISVGDGTDKNYSTTGIEGYASYYYVDVISAKSFRLYTTSNQTYPATKQTLESLGIEAGKKYTLECDVDITTGTATIGTRLSNNSTEEASEVLSSDGHITFTFTPASAVYLSFFGSVGTSVKCDVTYSNIVLYEGNPRTNHTATWTPAIYQGNADFVGGILTTYPAVEGDYIVVTLNTSEMNSGSGTNYPGWNGKGIRAIVGSGLNKSFNLPMNIGTTYGVNTAGSSNDILYLDKSVYGKTLEEWQALAIDVQVVLKVGSPTPTQITPTNLPIKSLSGYNHIESSTGEMEVEYFPAKEQPLIDLIPEASNMHTYSTQEQIVGKWVDGKDIYEKTYVFQSLPSVGDWTAFDEDCGIDTLVDCSLMYTRSNGQIDNGNDLLKVAYNPPNAVGDLCYYSGGVEETHITVRYTKTSSNNRSLKSAPQEEQVEELKEEPTEEVKEELEEVKEELEEIKEEETKEEGEVNER